MQSLTDSYLAPRIPKKQVVQSGAKISGSIKDVKNYVEAYYKLSGNSKATKDFFYTLINSPMNQGVIDMYALIGMGVKS